MARGPGPVAAFHRLLIATAFLGTLAYVAWELREWSRGDGSAVLRAVAGAVVAAGFAVYLRSLRSLGSRLTPPGDGRRG